MTKEFSSIMELKAIREQKSRLSERENELSSPILTDFELIPEVYSWFKEILSERSCPPNIESVTQRKKFLFIILFLFAPSVLAGGKMKSGLREKLAMVLKIQSKSTISDNISSIVFIYQNYPTFRKDIEHLYIRIIERLKIKELIK